ncbi:MAG: hypothetical protein IK024_13395 [Treponema sp.]|nr:hypothetical protein [Treponema sp.]
MSNYFEQFDWKTMMSLNAWPDDPATFYDIKKYHKILSPDYPDFLDKYIALPILSRLKGVGLLCGTDWTKLYKNRFYYSRLDHSVGVALIIWHFTHDKAQTLAGLFHDASTPVFSHVSDFRKGDALTQTATESDNERLLKSDSALCELLADDGLTVDQICDYHIYPVADNEIPQLSADRLEYMFPSGMALDGSWDLASIEKAYNDITVLKNEDGFDELGFQTLEIAEDYCRRFCMIGHILQLNENKLTLHMLGQIMNLAVEQGVLHEDDFMNKSEREIMDELERAPSRLYKTFRTMTSIEHTDHALPTDEYFCISLNVKQRYIDPLVIDCRAPFDRLRDRDNDTLSVGRLSAISPLAHKIIEDFKAYHDTPYGCVKLV